MSTPSHISKSHRRMLFDELDIAPEIAAERGTFTARRGKDVPQEYGLLPRKPGIVFPVHTLDGEFFYRLRLDHPGRLPKYMQPKGMPNRLDIHPRQHERIKQPGGVRYVTEGEKKVDAGVSRNMLMVGLSGVWNGQKNGELTPDWEYLPLKGERYTICYDSDIETNPHVQMAADRQAQLLQQHGAEVFITLIPPAPDGSKQGLDDFLANGGTLRELELLTQPYEPQTVERVRLSRDEKLRAAVEDLERRFWAFEWKGQGGHSARDVALKLIETARRYGEVVDDGIRVTKAWGPLALEAKISSRTLSKAIGRLEEWGFAYRDNEGRKADKAGAFVLRATVNHYEKKQGRQGKETQALQKRAPGTLHLRAPRLRWSQPKFTPKRGTVAGTRMVRQGPKREPRDRIERLGKIRGAILDTVDHAGGVATIQEIAEALHRGRPRELTRRKTTVKGRSGPMLMLEEAGIVTVEGDTVTLAENWLERLDEVRGLGREIEAEDLARKRYKDKQKAYHYRHKVTPDQHYVNVDADGHVEDLQPDTIEPEVQTPVPEESPLATAIRDYLDRNPRDADQPPGWIGRTLWTYDLYPKLEDPAREVRTAIDELGGETYLRDCLERARGAVA